MPRGRLLALLFGLLAASVLVSPLRRDLFVGDETKYSQVIREMRATGAFFLPTLGGRPFTHKPPLHFWIVDTLTYPFGTYSMWPFVIPSLVAFALLLWILYRMRGPLAAFVCGTSLMIWASAQSARMDVEFTALLTLAAWQLFQFFEGSRGERASRPLEARRAGGTPAPLCWCALATAIATLIKGPMAPVIILILFALECWRRRLAPRVNYAPALAAMIVIPLLWVIPALIIGGRQYAHDVIVKQTVGRAFSTWVHKAPPWYYLTHAPADVFPWFFIGVVAIVVAWKRGDDLSRFCLSWIAAVLLPYSLLSSKLDIYMMALIPPLAIVIASAFEEGQGGEGERWAQLANRFTLALFAVIGIGGFFLLGRYQPQYDTPAVKGVFVCMALAAMVALLVARGVSAMTWAIGVVSLVTCVYLVVVLVPMANEFGSTRPLIAALAEQHVPPEEIALYSTPALWSRDMPRELERVRYVSPEELTTRPTVIAVARKNAKDLAPALAGYRVVRTVFMIGKPFDVYRR
jgi:4-amino-4-deoxy-L-arabinose transferase-like glycosyltransferase